MSPLPGRARIPFGTLLFVFTVGLAARAGAQEERNADADAAIEAGVSLRRQGRNEEALESFQRAYRLAPNPRAQAQMGLARQAIGQWANAESDLLEALKHPGDPWIARQRKVLEGAVVAIRRHLGGLAVTGKPIHV